LIRAKPTDRDIPASKDVAAVFVVVVAGWCEKFFFRS